MGRVDGGGGLTDDRVHAGRDLSLLRVQDRLQFADRAGRSARRWGGRHLRRRSGRHCTLGSGSMLGRKCIRRQHRTSQCGCAAYHSSRRIIALVAVLDPPARLKHGRRSQRTGKRCRARDNAKPAETPSSAFHLLLVQLTSAYGGGTRSSRQKAADRASALPR